MKGPFSMLVISVFFVSTKEQCPTIFENIPLTSCDGLTKHGPVVYVDFNKINHPCTCIVTPSFNGELLVTSKEVLVSSCNTEINVQNSIVFGCPIQSFSSQALNVQINQSVEVRAEYILPHASGTFYHCLGLQQNGGSKGNVNVICRPPPKTSTTAEPLTTVTTTLHFSHASSSFATSIESTSVANSNENTDATTSSNTTTVGFNSLSMESTQDVPENMMYIIAGSAAGGAIILVGLVVLVLVLINRMRSTINKDRSTEAGMARTNEVFDSNPELPNNPLYLTSPPLDELGYSSDQEKQLGLPPKDSKTKKKINPDYDVPPNNKPISYGTSSMPVYAVPKRSKDRTPEISSVDVYAEVCKPNRSTAKDPVRKRNEDGLLYMQAEQDTAATKQTNIKDKHEITEGVCYAEIKHT